MSAAILLVVQPEAIKRLAIGTGCSGKSDLAVAGRSGLVKETANLDPFAGGEPGQQNGAGPARGPPIQYQKQT